MEQGRWGALTLQQLTLTRRCRGDLSQAREKYIGTGYTRLTTRLFSHLTHHNRTGHERLEASDSPRKNLIPATLGRLSVGDLDPPRGDSYDGRRP